MHYINIPRAFFNSRTVGKASYRLSAVYFLISSRAKNGSIHNYKTLLKKFSLIFNIGERTLSNDIKALLSKKWLKIQGNNLLITSKREILRMEGIWDTRELKNKRCGNTKNQKIYFSDYAELKLKLKIKFLSIYTSSIEYMIKKNDVNFKKKFKKKGQATNVRQVCGLYDSSPLNFGTSRMSLSNKLGFKSKSTASALIKKGVEYKVCKDTVQPSEMIVDNVTKNDFFLYQKEHPEVTCKWVRRFGIKNDRNVQLGTISEVKANIVKISIGKEW